MKPKQSLEAEINYLNEKINKLIMERNEKYTEFLESRERFNNTLRLLVQEKAQV